MSEIKPIRDRWPGTMTDRERFNNQMHYKPVDRCVNREFGYWNENFTLWDIFRDNGITNNAEADALLAGLLRESGQRVRLQAVRAIEYRDPAVFGPLLRDALRTGPSVQVRAQIEQVLGRWG